jgi:hypothetical protein
MQMSMYWDGNDDLISGVPKNQKKGNTATGSMMLDFARHHSNSLQDVESDDNLLVVRARKGGSTVPVFILDVEGDIYVDGNSSLTVFDTYDDAALLSGLRATVLSPKDVMYENLHKYIEYARPVLEKAGIVHYDEQNNPYISMKGCMFLTMDAVRQASEKLFEITKRIVKLEEKLEISQDDPLLVK